MPFAPDPLPPLTPLKKHAALIIDQERIFCKHRLMTELFEERGNAQTEEVAKRNRLVLGRLKMEEVPVYIIHYGDSNMSLKDVNRKLFRIKATSNTRVVGKNANSAIEGSNLDKILREDKRKILWVMGFNFSACIEETAIDAAKKGYEVYVLLNCVADGYLAALKGHDPIATMRKAGVKFVYARQALDYFRQVNSKFGNYEIDGEIEANPFSGLENDFIYVMSGGN